MTNIKKLIAKCRNDDGKKSHELLVNAVIDRDFEQWMEWGQKDVARELAAIHSGEPRVSDHTVEELIEILSTCPECSKEVDIKTAIEANSYLFHKKCFKK